MSYMGRKSSRKKKSSIGQVILAIIAVIVIVYLLANINLPILSNISGAIVNAIDVMASAVKGVISEGTGYFGNVSQLNQENANLKEELEKTKMQLIEMGVLEAENADLKEMLEIDEKYNHFEKVYANVILRDYNNWNETFVINKGTNDGIAEKQTVISSEGLVGYISSVSKTSSTVTTIIDPSTSVSVEISTINKLALLKGDFTLKSSQKIKLTNIPMNYELSVGEKVYTAGIGTMYEKGILIGEIANVVNSKNDVDRYAEVVPYTDFSSLDIVAIITK